MPGHPHSTPGTDVLHGAQLWVALPARWQHERAHPDDGDRRFGVLPAAWVSTLPAPELPNARLRPRG